MRYFCTYFDRGYLRRGLALYSSLRRHCPAFRLWALCLDEASHRVLTAMALPGVEPIALTELEGGDAELLRVKGDRSRVEYYFTLTPALPLYIFERWPEVSLITYLDADLYFFADPRPLFDELGGGSVAITPHRFSRRLRHYESHGRYNVGWVSFRRDASGLACLRWWRERCLEWCYDRAEPGRFADQKYLDEWPRRFAGVVVIRQRGANLAPWNIADATITAAGDEVRVDGDPLIFFHFHGLRQPRSRIYNHQLYLYKTRPSPLLLRRIYGPYIRALAAMGRPPAAELADRLADRAWAERHA
ncbi:MAG TPA: hypothetical protein PKD53_25615, partial [Chloroflexaceae bacterium]|nr:hypothetical protein [Chloroflexaceae bacterium]